MYSNMLAIFTIDVQLCTSTFNIPQYPKAIAVQISQIPLSKCQELDDIASKLVYLGCQLQKKRNRRVLMHALLIGTLAYKMQEH